MPGQRVWIFGDHLLSMLIQTHFRATMSAMAAALVSFPALFGQPGSRDPSFNSGSGFDAVSEWDRQVNAVVIQPDGRVLVGGAFNTYYGTGRNRIARLNDDGSLDSTFDPGSGFNHAQPFWDVNAIALDANGRVIVGGHFTSFNGVVRNSIARLNADGSLDETFGTANGFNGNSYVFGLAVQSDGKVLVAGEFNDYEGHPCRNLLRLNTDGSFDPSFDPGTGPNAVVYTMTLFSGDTIVIGGGFDAFDGTATGYCVRLLPDGAIDASYDMGSAADERVWSLAVQPDGKLLIGGQFTAFNGSAVNHLVRLNNNGSPDASFDPGPVYLDPNDPPFGLVRTIACEPDGGILIGGRFTSVAAEQRAGIARLFNDGALDATFDPGSGFDAGFPFERVVALALRTNGRVVVGGTFTTFNGTTANRIVQLFGDCVPGTPCNDGLVTTGPDVFTEDCVCTGPAIDCEGTPDGTALPGTPCDDGSAATGEDVYQPDCTCAGKLIDCLGVPGGAALPGTACDDGDPTTGNDEWSSDCACQGLLIDCAGIPGGTALPGSPCNDDDVLTGPDQWNSDCICTGPAIDCLGVPNGSALPGTACDDGLASTVDDAYSGSCTCEGVTLCETSQLTSDPDPVMSCGAVELKFDGTSIIAATEVPGANRYQFHFANVPGQPAYSRNIAFATRTFTLGQWATHPLKAGRTYLVTVRSSFDHGTTWCPFGPVCTVRMSHFPFAGMAQSEGYERMDAVGRSGMDPANKGSGPTLAPNPTNGPITVQLDEAGWLTLLDATGRTVMTRFATVGSITLDLGAFPNGVYLLRCSGHEVWQLRVVKQ